MTKTTYLLSPGQLEGVKNYFTDSLLYRDSHKTNENPHPEDPDSGNEADTETEPEEECLWELNSCVTSINNFNFNNTTNVEGEWFINKNLDLVYLSVLASDFVPSDTSTDVDSDPLSARCLDIIARTSKIIPHSVWKDQ